MVGDIYGQQEKILASVDQAADRDTQKFGQGLVSGTQILAKQMDTLNNNARLLLDANIANSNIDAEYNLEEMRKNVELAVKTADMNVRAAIANLQADTEIQARKYDTDVRAEISKNQTKAQLESNLQGIIGQLNIQQSRNEELIRGIYQSLVNNLNNRYTVVVESEGKESSEAKAIKKQMDDLEKKIVDGLKILNKPLLQQKKDLKEKLTGITVSP